MKLDSLLGLKLSLAVTFILLLNGCNSSNGNLIESIKRSSIFTSDSQKVLEQDENIFNKSEKNELETLTNLSNADKAENSTASAAVIAPVAAIDKFFGNLRIQSIFDTEQKTSESTSKKLSDLSNTNKDKDNGVHKKLTAAINTVDNFFKSFEKPSFFTHFEPVDVPEAEKLSTKLIDHNADFEITNALLRSPVVAVASQRAFSSSKSLKIIAAQKNPTANISINTGIFPEDGKVKPGAQGTISVSKFIFDYGQTDRQLRLAALETKSSILNAHVAMNTELTKLLQNFVLLDGANQSIEVINSYLLKYEEREKTIKTAVTSGILSRADLLEIEAAKNNIDSQYERLKLTQEQSTKFLKTYLNERFLKVSEEVNRRLKPDYEFSYSEKNVSADLIAVRRSALETEIEIAENFDKFRINTTASISSPSPVNDSFTTFAGFSITKPILDGGQSPATIDKKKADLEVLKQEITALEFERELIISSWDTYKKYHRMDDKFLTERKTILSDQSVELERRFTAGQVDIVSLARAILTSAQAEVDLIQHRTELKNKKLETASGLSQPCALLNICADVQKIFPTE